MEKYQKNNLWCNSINNKSNIQTVKRISTSRTCVDVNIVEIRYYIFFIRILTLILTPTIFLFNVYGMNEMKIFNHPIILYLLMNSRHLSKNTIIKCLRFSIFIKKLLKYLPIVILQKVIDINKLKIINHPIIPLPFEDHPWLTKGQRY